MNKSWAIINIESSICNPENPEYICYIPIESTYYDSIKLINDINPCNEDNAISRIIINTKIEDIDEYIDTSNPEILESYLKNIKSTYITKYTCLILSGHGYTWFPDFLLNSSNKKYTSMSVTENLYYKDRPATSLKKTLHNIGGVDILVFNTCSCMAVENLYNLRNECSIIIGNMDYTGWKGLNEEEFYKGINNNDPMTLAKLIVDNFSPQLDGTINYAISAYKTIFGETLRTALCYLSYNLIKWINNDPIDNLTIIKDIRSSIAYPDFKTGEGGNGAIDNISVDLSKLCIEFNKNIDNIEVKNYTSLVLDILSSPIISYIKSSDSFEGLRCLSIYFPDTYTEYLKSNLLEYTISYKELYKNIPFNNDKRDPYQASWSDFLDRYYQI